MAWSLGGDETEVHLGGTEIWLKWMLKPWAKSMRSPSEILRPDLGGEDGRLPLVGEEHHHYVRIPRRVGNGL